jgi:hypothetical protein
MGSKDMSIDRRSFVVVAATAAAIHPGRVGAQSKRDQRRDPLGARDDFPIVSDHSFLNSAYIAPAPRPVVDASHAHIRGKSARPVQLNTLMAANDPIRTQFARIVNAAR